MQVLSRGFLLHYMQMVGGKLNSWEGLCALFSLCFLSKLPDVLLVIGRRGSLRPHAPLSDSPADDPCIFSAISCCEVTVVVRIRKPVVIGPLQLVIRVVQNRYTVEQVGH